MVDNTQDLAWIRGLSCPACGKSNVLFVTNNSEITCSWHACPEPDYSKALETHIAKITTMANDRATATLAKAQLRMRPLIALLIALQNANGEIDGNWYVMYWDEGKQVWNKARYEDILEEVKKSMDRK